MSTKRSALLTALVISLALLLAACGGGSTGGAPAPSGGGVSAGAPGAGTAGGSDPEPAGNGDADRPLRKVTMIVGHQAISPGEEVYAYAVPLQLGYFAEEGLEVELQTSAGSAAAVQLVTAGQAEFGMGNSASIMNAVSQGAPIIMVYNVIPAYGSGLAVLPDSSIQSPRDLKGKTIGVPSLGSSRYPEARAMVIEADLEPDVDVQFVAVGAGAQAATALTSGQVDGLYLWDAAYAAIEGSGVKLRIIRDVFEGAENLLDYMLYAHTDLLGNEPEVVAGLGRAIAKGTIWALNNPDAAMELYYRTFPDAKPQDDAGLEADRTMGHFAIQQVDIAPTPLTGWGHLPEDRVQFTVDFNVRFEIIDSAEDLDLYFTNQFLEEYNRLDAEAIGEHARNYQP